MLFWMVLLTVGWNDKTMPRLPQPETTLRSAGAGVPTLLPLAPF